MSNDNDYPQIDLAIRSLRVHVQRNRGAADTFEGIARWWLGADSAAISHNALHAALQHLVEAGVLSTRLLPSGETLWYSLADSTPGANKNRPD